jgi:hypothetical protein
MRWGLWIAIFLIATLIGAVVTFAKKKRKRS